MAVPPLGQVLTPSGFLAISAQGQVLLTWNYTPLATTYYINRSPDNVTFTNIGQTSSLQYSDTTGTVGTVYYYQVQAATTLASGLATVSQAAINLSPGKTTVANIRLECQQRSDRVNTENITTQEWNSMINQSFKELWDILAQKFGNDYFVAVPYTYTTSLNVQYYPLPTDFKALLGVEVALNNADPNSWVSLKSFMFIERNFYNNPNVYTYQGTTNLKYRLNGNNLMIVPAPQSGQTIRIQYVPRPNQLINDTDLVDGVAGWEEYIVTDVCIKAMVKCEENAQDFKEQKMGLLKRIEEASEHRDIGEPQTVSDIKRMNSGYGNYGSSDWGGNGWGW